MPHFSFTAAALLFNLSCSFGYTVLTHEAIIDSAWDATIVKALRSRFPKSTAEDLIRAHAFAYGGCIIQDMGYAPFSSQFFSELTHYVRSGDFVEALIRQSESLNEYAFALGALEHYVADVKGHKMATNPAVGLLYPDLARRFGPSVTYWDAPVPHIKTEFGFDVLQVALGRYAPSQYRNFIGFEVSRELLERAFQETYSLELKDVLGNVTLALGSYRHSIGVLVPGITRVAWSLKGVQLQKEIPGMTRKKFLYNLSRSSYEKEWGREYRKPGFGTAVIAFLLKLVPKVGPFKALAVKPPTPEVERMFMASFNSTLDMYTSLVNRRPGPTLDNENLDLGEPTARGHYKGADNAYAKLLRKLADHKFAGVSAGLKTNIVDFYRSDANPLVEQLKQAP